MPMTPAELFAYLDRLGIAHTAGRITVVLDAGLMAHETINAHPLINTMTTSISRDDLLKFLRATGHEPRIVPLASAATETANGSP